MQKWVQPFTAAPRLLTLCVQLWQMRLTAVPSELFRMTNLRSLSLFNNNLCSLPSEIAHLKSLERLTVRDDMT
jgi:Leucine-rich repeat (LRR) protein